MLLLSVVVLNGAEVHTTAVPVFADGVVLTVIGNNAEQPAVDVYDIVIVPAAIPVTIPVEVTEARLGLLLFQLPPVVVSVKVVLVPVQTVVAPVIAFGVAFTVMGAEAKQPEPNV